MTSPRSRLPDSLSHLRDKMRTASVPRLAWQDSTFGFHQGRLKRLSHTCPTFGYTGAFSATAFGALSWF